MIDRLSWLLSYISFVVDHPWTFRSILRSIVFTLEDGYFLWITAVPCVYNPEYIGIRTHAQHGTLCPGMGFQNIKTPGNSAETAGQNIRCEIVLISIYSPRKTGISSVNGATLCLQSDSTSPSDERWHSQQHWALAGRTVDVAGPLSPRSNCYFKTTWKQMIH